MMWLIVIQKIFVQRILLSKFAFLQPVLDLTSGKTLLFFNYF